ncbi:hypothetical protein J2Y58_000239 [Sphingomonas sp. BE138]|nr:hypothetical protein [Sphingomonas sp. BE138]
MPVPTIAPIPRAIRCGQLSVLRSLRSGSASVASKGFSGPNNPRAMRPSPFVVYSTSVIPAQAGIQNR